MTRSSWALWCAPNTLAPQRAPGGCSVDELTQWADLTVAASHRKPLNYETASYTCLLETGQLRCLGWELTRRSQVLF